VYIRNYYLTEACSSFYAICLGFVYFEQKINADIKDETTCGPNFKHLSENGLNIKSNVFKIATICVRSQVCDFSFNLVRQAKEGLFEN